MSEFCKTCPMRGTATGNLIATVDGDISYKTFGGEQFSGKAGVLVDENGGLSEPIAMPSAESSKQRLFAIVEDCQEPITKEKGIFRKREVVVGCPAIGRLAMSNPQIKEYINLMAELEIVGFSALHKPSQG